MSLLFSFVSMVPTHSRNFCFSLWNMYFTYSLPLLFACLFTFPHLSFFSSFSSALILSFISCVFPSLYPPTTHYCTPSFFSHTMSGWTCLRTSKQLTLCKVPPALLAKFILACFVYFQCSDFYNSFQKVPLNTYDGCSVHFWRCEVLKLNSLFSTKGILLKCWQMLCQKYIL